MEPESTAEDMSILGQDGVSTTAKEKEKAFKRYAEWYTTKRKPWGAEKDHGMRIVRDVINLTGEASALFLLNAGRLYAKPHAKRGLERFGKQVKAVSVALGGVGASYFAVAHDRATRYLQGGVSVTSDWVSNSGAADLAYGVGHAFGLHPDIRGVGKWTEAETGFLTRMEEIAKTKEEVPSDVQWAQALSTVRTPLMVLTTYGASALLEMHAQNAYRMERMPQINQQAYAAMGIVPPDAESSLSQRMQRSFWNSLGQSENYRNRPVRPLDSQAEAAERANLLQGPEVNRPPVPEVPRQVDAVSGEIHYGPLQPGGQRAGHWMFNRQEHFYDPHSDDES